MAQPTSRVIGSRVAVAVASVIVTTLVVSGGLAAFAQEAADEAAEIVAPNQVNSASVIDNSLRSVDLRNGGVASIDILNNTVTSTDVQDGSIASLDVTDGSLSSVDILNNSLTGTDIADSSISAADLATDSVSSSEIVADSVGSSEIAAGIISNDELGTVTQRSATSASIANNTSGSATASCLAGEQVLSGGNDGTLVNGFDIVASRQEGNGWRVFLFNTSGGARTVTAHAYCLAP